MHDVVSLPEALRLTAVADEWHAEVQPGYDVFGIPHGGYLAALAAHAALRAAEAPDVFTATTHFVRKARFGALRLRATKVGASRRFATWTVTARQHDEVVIASMVSVGDRRSIDGPQWSAKVAPDLAAADMLHASATDKFPAIAQVCGMKLDRTTVGFLEGRTGDRALIRATMDVEPTDQLAGIVASDITPPVAWNALGAKGWVPTVELTTHVRARPQPGPLTIEAESRFIADGFLEEDAVVFDADGVLVVQSRQLARWTTG